ncbi:TRAP transporter large permease subunit [Pseudooceanicola sp. GBMRC 2024]|uniref:TRAP transporter large permease protein n=1 Tax=Pseudooceanicola albus TaxID=2692189 RepID=A0A6L7G0B9_9RHOB|nr:TRAP transporter large permease [Pseudooceanicola albus]MXN17784.1 TRAP transporter large permease subunit [Pseudooceanicola albus]
MIWTVAVSLLGLMALSIPVGIVLFLLGIGVGQFFSPFPLLRGMGQMIWSSSASSTLIAIPLFVLLGELLVRGGVAARTYAALDRWLSWLPGGLIHANIATATMFSATSGSSVATAATVATVAMPQGERMGYDPRLFSGAIAAGGTLGILIPPSINLIVYGFLTESSIPSLFVAGLLPGGLMALGFILVTALICRLRPGLGGPSRSFTWEERLRSLVNLVPIIVLFLVVVGSIYAGWATPTESAAIGVVMAALIAAFGDGLKLSSVADALVGTVRITAMIMLVITAAFFLNFAMSSSGMGRQIGAMIEGAGLSPYATLLVVILLYVVLGLFIETLSLMVATIPIVVPIISGMGFDTIWFGVLMIILIEMALITPPVGLNLFVVQSVRRGGSMNQVAVGVIPYVAVMVAMLIALIALPGIALWLPSIL